MIPSFIDRSKLPHKPGVYIYHGAAGKILYVGKALDLYHRVASYFSNLSSHSAKTLDLVRNISQVETIVVESELEALILEANLIKKYLPPYNVRLTDDKDYLYIKITDEDFPRIITARKKDLDNSLKFFGPFPSAGTVKSTLRSFRRVFPWCNNPLGKRSCFFYHLNLCPGPCAGEITKDEYRKITKRFIKFMEGQKTELIDELNIEMNQAAKNLQFELAGKIKKILEGIIYLTQPNSTKRYLENPNFLEDARVRALEQLTKDLKLSELPERVECFDISNIQGNFAVASMVVLTNGEIDKSQYRKFKMSTTGKPNDFAMHQETILRRMKHSEWKTPNVLLIDGGKGQVSSVYAQIKATGSDEFKKVPIFGIAKRMEWLYTPDGQEIRLPKSHPGLRLLIKLRDESHRFAITFYRQLHSRSLVLK